MQGSQLGTAPPHIHMYKAYLDNTHTGVSLNINTRIVSVQKWDVAGDTAGQQPTLGLVTSQNTVGYPHAQFYTADWVNGYARLIQTS